MSITNGIRFFLKHSKIFNFNVMNRDAWIAKQANLLPEGSSILDAGAGSCPYRDYFTHCEYKSQDFADLKGEQLSGGKYGKIDYVSDILSIPVEESSFDAILCSEVLEHLPDPVRVIYEFSRILKNGGKLIITAPLGSGIHQDPYHYYGGYTPYWYRKFLEEAGFKNVLVEENAGSLQACGQESMRFIQLSRPFKMNMPLWAELIWLPCWLLLAPIMGIVAPISGHMLKRFDKDQRFTVGYHVTAIKSIKGSASG